VLCWASGCLQWCPLRCVCHPIYCSEPATERSLTLSRLHFVVYRCAALTWRKCSRTTHWRRRATVSALPHCCDQQMRCLLTTSGSQCQYLRASEVAWLWPLVALWPPDIQQSGRQSGSQAVGSVSCTLLPAPPRAKATLHRCQSSTRLRRSCGCVSRHWINPPARPRCAVLHLSVATPAVQCHAQHQPAAPRR
jgi:hypothetical protein